MGKRSLTEAQRHGDGRESDRNDHRGPSGQLHRAPGPGLAGYRLNFGEVLMKDGITRTINGQL